MRASVRVSLSSSAADVPLALPLATSRALASRMARVFACLMVAEDGRRTAAELSSALHVGAPAISGGVKALLQSGVAYVGGRTLVKTLGGSMGAKVAGASPVVQIY